MVRGRWIALPLLAAELTLGAATAAGFEVVGHRGARGVRPENTIASFEKAVKLGATVVEADLVGTRDDRLVVHHDRRVSEVLCRGPYVGRLVKSLTLEQVRELDCGRRRADDALSETQKPVPGAHIPELAQIMRLMKPTRARVLLELKIDPTHPRESPPRHQLVRILREVVRREKMVRRVTVQSFDWRVLKLVRRMEPRLRIVALATPRTAYRGSPWLAGVPFRRGAGGTGVVRAVARAGFDGVSPSHRLVTPAMIGLAHDERLPVTPYTVDDPAEMQRLIDMGVDGIVTDFPARLRRTARSAGVS